MNTTQEPRPLDELRPLYQAKQEELADRKISLTNIKEFREVKALGLREAQKELKARNEVWSAKRESLFSEALENPARDWEALAKLNRDAGSVALFLNELTRWTVESELPRLTILELEAECEVTHSELQIAQLQVEMADRDFRDGLSSINQKHLGVTAVSGLVMVLEKQVKSSEYRYHSALEALKREITSQEKLRHGLMNIGAVTSKQIGNAIPQ